MLANEIALLLHRLTSHNDELALKQLFNEFYPRLLLFARSFLTDRQVAEEVVEDVFIKLWENRTHLPAVISLSAYLFTATKHNIINYQKRAKNLPFLQIDDAEINLKADVKTPEELYISSESLQKVNAAIALLPPKCQLVFQLVKECGLKYKEAAVLLEISVKTVENQMSVALKKISEALLQSNHGKTASHPHKK